MFSHLTKYLSLYNFVSIPAIGSFEIIQQSSVTDLSERIIAPPAYQVSFTEMDAVRMHQLSFLAEVLKVSVTEAYSQLEQFGYQLKEYIMREKLVWKGVGILTYSGVRIVFEAKTQGFQFLQPVTALRVMRENIPHTVLVGDQEVASDIQEEQLAERPVKKKFSVLMIVAWVLIILALAFVIYHLYRNGWEPAASGNQLPFNALFKVSF